MTKKSKYVFGFSTLLLALFILPSSSFAGGITMTVEKLCGLQPDQVEVEIQGHGYASVSGSDNTVTADVPEGTKMSVVDNKLSDMESGESVLFGPWTPAKNGGVLPVQCLDPERDCESADRQKARLNECLDNYIENCGQDRVNDYSEGVMNVDGTEISGVCWRYCDQWAGPVCN